MAAAQRELDLAKQRKDKIRLLERWKKEEEGQALADAKKVMETRKTEAARKAEIKERKIRKVAAERHALEKEEEALRAKNEEERMKAEKEAEEAKKEAEKEKDRWRKAQNTPQQVVGEGWVWVSGKRTRNMTAIALTKARFDRGHQTTFDTWNKIVRELNELIIHTERADGGKPLFRVKGITCNPTISRFERRLEIAEARGTSQTKKSRSSCTSS